MDKDTNKPVGGDISPEKDKWETALNDLSTEDRKNFSLIETSQKSPQDVLVDLLAAVEVKKDECLRKRWKVVIKGRTIILRDVLDKLSVWVKKMMTLGDLLVQVDASFTSTLPWAAVKLMLQAGINESEASAHIIQSLESIANSIARCSIAELLYSQEKSAASKLLSKALVTLYKAILQYLSQAMHFYQSGTAMRTIKSLGEGKSKLEDTFKTIEASQDGVHSAMQLAEAEKSQKMLAGLEGVEDKLRVILDDLQQPISRVIEQMKDLHDGLERETRAKILRAISTVPYNNHHKTARSGRLEGSGQWLLTKPAFQSWRKDSSSSVLWLHGIPGSGKTKLASLVVDELRNTDNLAYFYCMRNPAQPERAQCDKILASLVRQLATLKTDGPLLPAIANRYEEAIAGFADFDDMDWTTEESSDMLLELLAEYPAVTLVVDALDEVNPDDRQELMDVLGLLMQTSPNLLKVIVSSRDNYDIALYLRGSPNVYIDADDNAIDIQSFIDAQLKSARLLRGKLPDDLKQKITNTLLSKARGMFRWVDLQIQSLRHLKLAADIQNRLGDLPETLEGSYWEIFQYIRESGTQAAALAEFAFQWLLYATKSVTIQEFAAVASSIISSGTDSGFSSAEIVDVCSNLVVVRSDNDFFDFCHLSVREFLEKLPKRDVKIFLPNCSNSRIAQACLSYVTSQIQVVLDQVVQGPDATKKRNLLLLEHFNMDSGVLDNEDTTTDADKKEKPKNTPPESTESRDLRNSSHDDAGAEANDSHDGTMSEIVEPNQDGSDEGNNEQKAETENAEELQESLDENKSSSDTESSKGQSKEIRKYYYAALQWPKHVSESKELYKEAPLADMIHNFLLDPSRTKTSDTFQLWTLLIRAAGYMNLENVDYIVSAATNPPNPVWIVCLSNWPEIIEFVYQAKSEKLDGPSYGKNTFSKTYSCPWEYAVTEGNIALVESLIRCGAARSFTLLENNSFNPLESAVIQDDLVLLSILLKNAENTLGVEDAMVVAASRDNLAALKRILDETADIESYSKYRALYTACQKGRVGVVSFLLDRGTPTELGSGLLCQAVLYHHDEVTRRLLERGIGLDGLDRALTIAVVENATAETVALLKERGAKKEKYAIYRAIRDATPNAALCLVQGGYPLHGSRLEALRTELHMAAQKGFTKVAHALINRSDHLLPLEGRDRDGRTPLHLAAMGGNTAVVQLLLERGADVLAKDDAGKISLDYAEEVVDQSSERLIRQRMEELMKVLQFEMAARKEHVCDDAGQT